MAVFPIQAAAGNPVGRSQTVAVSAIRRFSGQAANASTKLTTQERIVAPGDDTLGYSVSRNMRADIESLKVVSQTGQLNASALTLALAGLDSIKSQLDVLKSKIVEAQVADSTELDAIQAEIDLALSQIDSTANNTKLGSRSLLNGNSSIKAVRSIAANGTVTNISILQVGQSIGQTSGIQAVRVNKIGSGAPTRILTDGTQVLSLNVSVRSVDKNRRAFASITAIGAAAADFIELRVTGKLGSAVIRLNSTSGNLANLSGAANAFNKLASETGVVLTSQGTTATMGFLAIGFTKDDFVKLELLDGTGAW
ncbi:MAG: flagellin, partial [Planctomycetaceae bacterium]|nr:flagellin [Planctomycetaceae bacterium]